MPLANIGDLNIYYQIQGQGPPLLLIMGYRGSSHMWGDELLALLVRHFQVIIFDNRGTGQSDKPNTFYTIPTMADDAAGLLRYLGIARAHVVGVSMGGMVAQELALRHPRRIARLVLCCTTCGGPQAILAPVAVLERLLAPPDMPHEEALRRQWPVLVSPTFLEERPHFLEHMTARALAYPTPLYSAIRQAMAIQRFNTYGRLGQIIAPTLILTGIGDLVVPPANSHLLAARIPGALLHVIPEAGHGFFWENPQHFVDLVQSFCIQEGWQWRDDTRRKHF